MKKLLSLLLVLSLALVGAAGCGDDAQPGGNDNTELTPVKVGASPTPHAEILEVAQPLMAEKGYDLQIVEFTDYVLPNTALENGDIDANYFQHITYMNDFNEQNGTHLAAIAEIHYEPMGIYAGKTASLEDLADGATVGVPADTTNEARALLLLEAAGLITVDPEAGLTATVYDITDNPKNLQISEIEAAQLPRSLADLDIAVINANYALQADLSVTDDALLAEAADSTAAQAYANVLTVREGSEEDPALVALAEVLKSDTVRQFIIDTYNNSVQPLF
ncbi:MAG TPA: metal ABC transporter substrate-binding protein [Candidatus Avidehalobacter gallistercoris]|uniref:Lipoprotein n=1 Tax=Candidatus Avidehalobacter gallistercoris TaxID=2840694 RepID=A0A9D1HIP1_9FIRM|nr:metal ABC transporter substrate-binding protein [Candidatus Avidehalobacter gallistercoris]